MSWKIQISRAKPNPKGKDKSNGRPIASQLLGEWADLKNVGDATVRLSTIHLAHSEFNPGCTIKQQAAIYWNGSTSMSLEPGQIVRVHTGRSADSWQMTAEDRNGVHYHAFVESGSFILNNDCGDNLTVWWQTQDQKWHRGDGASYAPRPEEGRILQRVGDRLV